MKKAIFILTIFSLFLPQVKAKHSWALMEVAGAVGNIAVNTQNIDSNSDLGKAIDAYNVVMGIIGVKNVGKGSIKYLKELPKDVKGILAANGNLRNLITNQLEKIKISYAKYIDLLDEQRKTYDEAYHGKRLLNRLLGIKETLPNLPVKWKQGWNADNVLDILKGKRPDPSEYLDAGYITQHIAKFEKEGGAFIIKLRDLYNEKHATLAPRKFIGLKSEMDVIISKYNKSNKNLQILIDELDLGSDYFENSDEVYYVIVKPDKGFEFDIPTGNEVGAYEGYWVPGGYTKHGTAEAVISNSANFKHNNKLNTFIEIFGKDNVLKIK
jgi:hypothetical protein